MEVRCGKCNKLFRVSDDKISGSGIKFVCTRCGEYVKITKDDFEQYTLSGAAASALASFEQKPAKPSAKAAAPVQQPAAAAPGFDLGASPAAKLHEEAPPLFVKPKPAAEPAPEPRSIVPISKKPEPKQAAPASQPQAAARPAPKPKAEPAHAAAPAAHAGPAHPASPVKSAAPAASASSGVGKKFVIVLAVLLVLAGAGYGVKYYLGKVSQRVSDAVKGATAPDGLQVTNAAGAVDGGTGDLVISGAVENMTDKPKPAWYIVADVYDAQGTVLTRAKMLSGKQLHTKRDYDILIRRGANVQDLKKKMQEQGVIIPPRGSVNFEIRIMEPPVGIASFNATLQPFDPVQLFKEIAEEQKQQ